MEYKAGKFRAGEPFSLNHLTLSQFQKKFVVYLKVDCPHCGTAAPKWLRQFSRSFRCQVLIFRHVFVWYLECGGFHRVSGCRWCGRGTGLLLQEKRGNKNLMCAVSCHASVGIYQYCRGSHMSEVRPVKLSWAHSTCQGGIGALGSFASTSAGAYGV